MAKIDKAQDYELVKECLAGSEAAWGRFYSKYVGLMRNVARKYHGLSISDSQDIVQSAFVVLTTALANFDPKNSLTHFVCMITERVLIDELRKEKAAKRRAETQSVEHMDDSDEVSLIVKSTLDPQDTLFEKAEHAEKLKAALDQIDVKCRELIRMRYYKDMSFGEIAAVSGVNENTLNVQTRRCLEKLKLRFHALEKG